MTDQLEIKPGVTFFFTGCADRPSDSIDVTSGGIEPMLSYDEAVESAKELTDSHGGANFIIECKVVACVSRGPMRVKSYRTRK